MRWQRWLRAALALAGLGCALAIYLHFGAKAPSGPPPLPPVDPDATSVMGQGQVARSKDGRETILITFERRSEYADGRVRFERVHMKFSNERAFEVWADQAETKGKSAQPDTPAELELSGDVHFLTKDGLTSRMDHATYNEVTGTLNAPGAVTFEKGRLTGDGVGARYDEPRNILSLLSQSHVTMASDEHGAGGLQATSDALTLFRADHRMQLDGHAHIVRDGDALSGDRATLHVTADEAHLTRIELRDHSRVMPGTDTSTSAPPDMQASDIDLDLYDDGQTIKRAMLKGRDGVSRADLTNTDATHTVISGTDLDFDLALDGQTVTRIDATKPVKVSLPKTADSGARRIDADVLKASGQAPGGLTSAQFDGHPVRFEEDVPEKPAPRTVTSRRLTLRLGGQLSAVDHALFEGTVVLDDSSGSATADIADYDAKAQKIHLTPLAGSGGEKPTARNADRTVRARAIHMFLGSSDLDATGGVETYARPSPPSPGKAASPLFAGDTPITGLAAALEYRGDRGTYTGAPGVPAQLRQDRSKVQGDSVTFAKDAGDLSADGHVEAFMPTSKGPNDQASTVYRVTNADTMRYADAKRQAVFTGKAVRLASDEDVAIAHKVTLTFADDSREIRDLFWEGDVVATLSGGRRAVGDQLHYDARTGEYVLTGSPAEVIAKQAGQADCGYSSGATLTFERAGGQGQGAFYSVTLPCDTKLPYKRSEDMATLRAAGLTKSYGGRTVVRDINLDVSSGEIVGLLGPNGAGKTTTFGMVVGLTGADKGKVLLDDEDVTADPMYIRARRGIGYLPQEASVFRGLTVEQNLLAILETLKLKRAEERARLAELLGELNLTPLAKARADTLSGGERRRVEITRALATRPKFMLLDEPFAGIDPIAVGDIQKIIFHLRDRGIGVLITDHNVRETLKITDRAYIVHDGVVFRSGTPSGLASDIEVKRIYLGADFRLD